MGLADEVKALCQSAEEASLSSKAREWATSPESSCKIIISTIKQIIKTRKQLPQIRLRALKLHHFCMMTNNVHYLNFAVKKILSRLEILAQHRRNLLSMGRGEDMFGAISLRSEENKQASADFLVCLLSYIRIWASRFGRYGDSRNTPYLDVYLKLTAMGVTFPEQEAQPRVQDLSSSDQESCRDSAELLTQLIADPEADPELLSQLVTTLKGFWPRIQQAGLKDVVTLAISRYENWKNSRMRDSLPAPALPSPRARLIRSNTESVLPSKAKLEQVLTLEKELASLQRQTSDFLSRLTLGKREAQVAQEEVDTEIAALIKLQNEELEDRKAKTHSRSELKNAESKEKNLVNELDTWELCIREKDKSLNNVLKEIEKAEEENCRLKLLLQGKEVGRSEDILQEELSSPIFPVQSTSANNIALWPLLLQADTGLLYSDLEVEVRYEFHPGNSLCVQISNKQASPLQGLTTQMQDYAEEGLVLALNREMEGVPIASGDSVTRYISPRIRDCYVSLPRLVISYQPNRSIDCYLPFPFLRFLTPGLSQDVQKTWDSLVSESDIKPLEGSEPWFLRFFSASPAHSLYSASFNSLPVLLQCSPGQVQCRATGAKLRLAVLTAVRLRVPVA